MLYIFYLTPYRYSVFNFFFTKISTWWWCSTFSKIYIGEYILWDDYEYFTPGWCVFLVRPNLRAHSLFCGRRRGLRPCLLLINPYPVIGYSGSSRISRENPNTCKDSITTWYILINDYMYGKNVGRTHPNRKIMGTKWKIDVYLLIHYSLSLKNSIRDLKLPP